MTQQPPQQPPVVVISMDQVYSEVQAMRGEVQAMRSDIRSLSDSLHPAVTEVRSDISDHETRIRALEKRVWRAAGATGVGAALVGIVVDYLAQH